MENIPKHIAIILDGNRRYAKKNRMPRLKGHEHGIKNVQNMIEWCKELGVKELSLYTFSTENFRRAKQEVSFLMMLYRKELKRLENEENSEEGDREGAKIRFIGKLDLFPKDIYKGMIDVMRKTKDNKGIIVNFCIAYGSRLEIAEACRRIAEKAVNGEIRTDDIDENAVSQSLWLKSDVDLMIRPGGEQRISNFLLWQNSYAEFIFTQKLWPEFTKKDLIKCVKEYQRRERRYGE